MKKMYMSMLIGILTIFMVVACSNTDEEVHDASESNDVDEDSSNEDSTDSNGGFFEVTEEPQLDLRLGDTGLVQTSIGTFELTVDTAEIVGTELDGEESLLDELILLGMTIKNISDQPLIAEDLISDLGITTNLEHSNRSNNALFFDSVEVFEGDIAPGEERRAQFIADVITADEYYFRPSRGVVASCTHNDIMWTILDEEARK